jgi:hypothetical protein
MFRILPFICLAVICTACAAGMSIEYKADGHLVFMEQVEVDG